MSIRQRLLGFAFAAADLLIEVDGEQTVTFALGAAVEPGSGAETLIGKSVLDLLAPASRHLFKKTLLDLKPGARSETLQLMLVASDDQVRRVSARMFILPDMAPNVSLALTYSGAPERLHKSTAPMAPVQSAMDASGFLDRARTAMVGDTAHDGEVAVSFLDIKGLGQQDDAAKDCVRSALQRASVDGGSAAQLTDDRYAVLHDPASATPVVEQLVSLMQDQGLDLSVQNHDVTLSGHPPLNALRALRFAVESCLKDGLIQPPDATFSAILARTVREADAFSTVVQDRSFDLHYQPIVDLKSGDVHHFEALSRFHGGASPFQTIHMAEELALIETFDLAVAEKAVNRLKQPGSSLISVAINVSGTSLEGDGYISALLRMTASNPQLRKRLIVEVTESSALADLEAANRRLKALKDVGIRLCIDDFGAGAASYDYIRGLAVDTVKIDGRFIQNIETDEKSRTLVAHLVDLCGSLKMTTIAEMIETEATAVILRTLGVDHGQGWLFGRPQAEPVTRQSVGSNTARRRGAVEAWG